MKYFILTTLFLLKAFLGFAQINMADSTAQVISYWEKGDKQSFTITEEKIKIDGSDTTSKEMTKYDVDVTVIKSDEKSYTIEWVYKNISSNVKDSATQKILNLSNNTKIIYKTDEMGVFLEVLNWKEVRDYVQTATSVLTKEYSKLKGMDEVIKQIEKTYSTKEAIESVAIKDIIQFHFFHGGKYTLGALIEGKLKVPNIYGKEPFDAELTVYLDEINEEDNNFIMRSIQEVNKEQLTNSTYEYVAKMAKNMNIEPPKREEVGELKNEILTSARIHGTGWVIYSVQTITVTSDKSTQINERIIEIK